MNAQNIATARAHFAAAIAQGATEDQAAQATWLLMRPKAQRAARWDEAIARGGSAVRNYRCPLGDVLGITSGERGQHSARHKRTQRSRNECLAAADLVLVALR